MNTITIEEAIRLVPAIGAREPSSRASNKYQFVSTQQILEQVQQKGWVLTGVSAQNQTLHSQHRATLVHKSSLESNSSTKPEGTLRIELFNSHNCTKRLMFAVGYFRFVCSNGLILSCGPAETIKTKHSVGNAAKNVLEQIDEAASKFPGILERINQLKSRQLTEQEQINFAKFAINGRYNYRLKLPKKFSDIEDSAHKILNIRRKEDQGNSSWAVFNRIQENVVSGIPNYTQPIRGYLDSVRVNQLLWKGADATLDYSNNSLSIELNKFLQKRIK